jgi:type II secretory pathway pseudopilin PulG
MQNNNSKQSGQLLLEILVAVSISAIVVSLGAQMVFVSMKSSERSGERDASVELARETFEAVSLAGFAKWQNIYNPPDGTGDANTAKGGSNKYYPAVSAAGNWQILSGSETVTVNDIAYTRYFTIRNVCRDDTTDSITGTADSDGASSACTASGGSFDPSTEQISVVVSWGNDSISWSEYLSRWRNKACYQTEWSGTASGTTTCPASTYGSESNVDFSAFGSLKIKTQ